MGRHVRQGALLLGLGSVACVFAETAAVRSGATMESLPPVRELVRELSRQTKNTPASAGEVALPAPAALAQGALAPLRRQAAFAAQESDKPMSCGNIREALEALREKRAVQDQTVHEYLDEIADLMGSWYAHLRPYEGRTVRIGYGDFRPIHDSSVTAREAGEELRNRGKRLDSRLKEIQELLPSCLK